MKEKYSVLTSIDGPNENVLVIKPPLSFSKGDVDQLIKAFELAVTVDLADISDVSSLTKTPT
jgi:4-aminobutyrate aminotransferase-like enzyme